MRAFTLLAIFGIAAAIKVQQDSEDIETTDEIDDTVEGDEEVVEITEDDLAIAIFELYDEDSDGYLS